ncbi:YceI family protein [Aeromicrobium sp. CF3.5]|uniref:YceI family protein n=1 Tax=Aeromicrobium sp. CF3.5 TaxID=3373078 RepID=UPI003EE656D6
MTTAPAVTTGTWTIDPTHAEIGFTVRHLMSKVRGKFETFESTLTTTDVLGASNVSVTVDLSSVNTGTADRDAHLKSADIFDADTHPSMTFTSTGIEVKDADTIVVTGDLTIRGVTKSVELAAELLGEGGDPWGGTRVGVEATGQISRKEFGIDFNVPMEGDKVMIGDKITLSITAEYVLQQA